MDTRQKYGAALLLVLIAGTAWLKLRGHPSVSSAPASNESAGVDTFIAPYGWQTPGIADNPVTLNGGSPFSSVVNLTVNPSYLGSLSQQYIPMFGFVGVGIVGAPANAGSGAGSTVPVPVGLPPAGWTSSNYTSTGAFSRNFIQSQSGASALFGPQGYTFG